MTISPKYRAFLKAPAKVDILEGTTYAGKTTIGAIKVMLKIAASPKRYHIVAGLDLGTLEKNIINPDYGILHVFGDSVTYRANGGSGITLPHISYQTPSGEKIIYVLGYDNKARWKKALGGQYGVVFIDEANVADMDFLREVFIRYDYMLLSLNPDDPSLPVYSEYINRSRPLPEWESETPRELLDELREPPVDGWVHWYFTFDHNAALTKDKREQLLTGTAKGTKLYKNKILGLRGRATGLVFNLEHENIITAAQARPYHAKDNPKGYRYAHFSCGVDTSYSRRSDDSFAFIFSGITACRKKITLAEKVYNNRDLATPLSPSDIPPKLITFLDACKERWGFARHVFIDSADAGTIEECRKYKRLHGSIYVFEPAWKKTKIIDRINLECGWLAARDYFIVDECETLIGEMNTYSWKEDKDEPEDKHDHCINADQYSFLPFRDKIGQREDARA